MPDAARAVDGEDDFVILEDVGETTVWGNPRDRLGMEANTRKWTTRQLGGRCRNGQSTTNARTSARECERSCVERPRYSGGGTVGRPAAASRIH